ncbi:MAG: MBL fold metallo-hydrolase, partial [Candidatus Marsarchaeota archaeon]|nr:MBL fold metallo-hydrolase [Candidatus Marsarchaeota archaeon]
MKRLHLLSFLFLTSGFWSCATHGCASSGLNPSFCSAQDLTIHHIDVGQSDCTFIETHSKTILVDAGNSSKGTSVVIPYLRSLRVTRINYVIASHYHADHIGGLDEVLDAFDVDTVFDRGTVHPVPKSKIYDSYEKAVGNTPRVTVQPSTKYELGHCIVLRFVASDGSCEEEGPTVTDPVTKSRIDENSLSIAFTVTFTDTESQSTTDPELRTHFTYFTGGDLTGYDDRDAIDLETSVASLVGHADAMKVNHHGSRSSTNQTFISALSPASVFISLGRN